jgi:hypothetical protein
MMQVTCTHANGVHYSCRNISLLTGADRAAAI